jgi:hypothetical protein
MANVFDKIVGEKHAVAESSLLKATEVGHIYSLKCHEDLDNGSIVSVGSWVSAQVFNSKEYAAGEHPIFILTPPLGYNSDRREYQDECYFYNAKGEVARGYELHCGDIFTVSADKFDGEPAVGKFIGADYAVAETAPESGFVGEIVEKVNYTNSVSFRVYVKSIGM